MFYVCSAIAALGAVIYFILADGELQDWAVPTEVNINMEIQEVHSLDGEMDKYPGDVDEKLAGGMDRAQDKFAPLVYKSSGHVS